MLDGETTAFDPDNDMIVPGDTLTKVCTFDITATGEHLSATLDVSTPSYTEPNDLTGALDVDATYKVGATADQAIITSDDDPEVLEATVVVSFPYGTLSTPDPATGADNLTQDLTAELESITINATQTPS